MQQNSYEEKKEFFQTLFKGSKGYIEIRSIDPKGKVKQDWYEVSELDRLLYELEKPQFKRVNTYFGVCPRRTKKGTEKDVSQANCLWVDLDAKDREEKRSIETKLDDFDPPPSIIISSGHGYHCYWLFDKPEEITSYQDILRVKGYNKGLAEELKGDKGIDLSRILRVPGTKNLKNPEETLAVTIDKFEPQIRYCFPGQFLARFKRDISNLEIEKVELDQDSTDKIPDRFWKILEENTKLMNTWKGKRKNLKDTSRSGYDFALANLLMHKKFSDSELISILRENEFGKGREAKPQYLTITIGKAKGTWEKRKKEKEKRLADKEKPPLISTATEEKESTEKYKATSLTDFLKQTPEEIPCLIGNGLLPKQGYLMIAGKAKEGKTKMALMFTLCLALGLPIFFKEDDLTGKFPTAEKVKALYLYREAEGLIGITLNKQIIALENLFKIKISKEDRDRICLKYPPKELYLDMTPGRIIFENIIKANPVDLVVIDPLSKFVARDMNKMPPVIATANLLEEIGRDYNCSFILIHHLNKEPTLDPFDSITGSSAWRNCYSSGLILQRRYEGRSDIFKKVTFDFRNAETPEFITTRRDSETSLFFEVTEEEALRGVSNVEKLVKMIEDNFREPVTYTKITDLAREKWGVTKARIAKLLNKAVKQQLLEKTGSERDTRYKIKTQKNFAL